MCNFNFVLHFSDDNMFGVDTAKFETLSSLRQYYHQLYKTRRQRPAFRFYLSVSHPDFGLLLVSGTYYFNDYSNVRFFQFSKVISQRALERVKFIKDRYNVFRVY